LPRESVPVRERTRTLCWLFGRARGGLLARDASITGQEKTRLRQVDCQDRAAARMARSLPEGWPVYLLAMKRRKRGGLTVASSGIPGSFGNHRRPAWGCFCRRGGRLTEGRRRACAARRLQEKRLLRSLPQVTPSAGKRRRDLLRVGNAVPETEMPGRKGKACGRSSIPDPRMRKSIVSQILERNRASSILHRFWR
jgi:hypothetical protein